MCAMMSCTPPGPNCKPYCVPAAWRMLSKMRGQKFITGLCQHRHSTVAPGSCPWEVVQLKGDCCLICLKLCYSVEDGVQSVHKENEPWEDTPCRTCTCARIVVYNVYQTCVRESEMVGRRFVYSMLGAM